MPNICILSQCLQVLVEYRCVSNPKADQYILTRAGVAAVSSSIPLPDMKTLQDDLSTFSESLDVSNKLQMLYILAQKSVHVEVSISTEAQVLVLGKLCQCLHDHSQADLERMHPSLSCVKLTENAWKSFINLMTYSTLSYGIAVNMESRPNVQLSKYFLGKSAEQNSYQRMWATLILHLLYLGVPIGGVAGLTGVSCGRIMNMVFKGTSVGVAVAKFAKEFDHLWAFAALVPIVTGSMAVLFSQELITLMELPFIGVGRARTLYQNGIKSLKDVAASSPLQLCGLLPSLSNALAESIITSADLKLNIMAEDLLQEAKNLLP